MIERLVVMLSPEFQVLYCIYIYNNNHCYLVDLFLEADLEKAWEQLIRNL